MPYRAYLPSTRRQWMSFFVFTAMVVFAAWQIAFFSYRQQLRQIQEKELKFWTSIAISYPSAIIAVDCDTGRIRGWNPAATRMLGWSAEEVEGRRFTFLVPHEYLENWYSSESSYLDSVTDPVVYTKLAGNEVKVINNAFVNTKSGKRLKCRVSIRTIGGPDYFYIATLDQDSQVQQFNPPSPKELKE